MRFSARYTASKGKQSLVLEDAPRPTRIGFLKGVLAEFIGTHRRSFGQTEPLDISETHQAFVALIRDEADPWDYDNESAWGALAIPGTQYLIIGVSNHRTKKGLPGKPRQAENLIVHFTPGEGLTHPQHPLPPPPMAQAAPSFFSPPSMQATGPRI